MTKLSDLPRDTKYLLYMDDNAGPNIIQEQKIKADQRKARANKLHEEFCTKRIAALNETTTNDQAMCQRETSASYKDHGSIIDPITQFLSPGFDVKRHLGISPIKSFVTIRNDPQYTHPKMLNSVRLGCPSAPPETRRESEKDPGGPGDWNCRSKPEIEIRSELKALQDSRIQSPVVQTKRGPISNAFPEFRASAMSGNPAQARNALNYLYKSSSQKANEDVPFDGALRPRKWPPTHTFESVADPVRHSKLSKLYDPPIKTWQSSENSGAQYERSQLRPDYYNAARPYTYVSPMPRAQQLPTYSGCVGSEVVSEIDNPSVPFKPFTVLRSEVPKWSKTGASLYMPGYTGIIPKETPSIRWQQPVAS